MKVAVFSATGDQGLAQVHALVKAGHTVTAIARRPEAAALPEGVTPCAADYADHDSLRAAMDGAEAVLLNLPSTSFQAAEPLIDATRVIAKAAAESPTLQTLVFNTSMPVPKVRMNIAAQDARLEMREILLASGAPVIVVQPVVYIDNLLKAWAWPEIDRENLIHYPHEETLEVCWICHADLASLMVAAAERPHLAGRVLDVGGPEAIRGPDLARRLGAVWNRPLRFQSMPVATCGEVMAAVFKASASLDSATLAREMTLKYTWYNDPVDRPFYVDMAPVLQDLPVRLTSLEDWAARQTLPETV
ncbi:SDR family oxidoreductase [Anianabacter salinae]|uniref:SDR family oxidoreductase n=1 Tax=Anianabacter salinae TaxID=2851023 RepID=UPI00225DFD21|nr:NAD(P)H-binding protein [Anianabacter salinae]MBV0911065.1 NmrA family NAD(P)-binding protein [Anianabacter salinae]